MHLYSFSKCPLQMTLMFVNVFSEEKWPRLCFAWFWFSLCAGFLSTSAASSSSPSTTSGIQTAVSCSGMENRTELCYPVGTVCFSEGREVNFLLLNLLQFLPGAGLHRDQHGVCELLHKPHRPLHGQQAFQELLQGENQTTRILQTQGVFTAAEL